MVRESQIDSFLYRFVCYGVHILCLAFASTIVSLIILAFANLVISLTTTHALATLISLNAAGLVLAIHMAYGSLKTKKELLRNKVEYICPLCHGCNIEFESTAIWNREFQIHVPKRIGDALCKDCDVCVDAIRRPLLKIQRQGN